MLTESLAAARREAHRSFGDDRLILERYLEGVRHVEVQVLFDGTGRGVHLGERDCSAQRRNQKIVEESPAPSVTPELRARMGDAALAVAAAAGYVNAGTVEMLLTDTGEFFFLEMNTRLQVEHPVTEAVTGRDLVADQLAIAAGATLADLGLEVSPSTNGHAVEARLYAEDPESGFLPATGRLALVRWPAGVRIDTGVAEGDVIGDRYDPMLAKVIAHGADAGCRARPAARRARRDDGSGRADEPEIPAMAACAARDAQRRRADRHDRRPRAARSTGPGTRALARRRTASRRRAPPIRGPADGGSMARPFDACGMATRSGPSRS